MNTEQEILTFLRNYVFGPVLSAADAPTSLKLGARFSLMCVGQLPAQSMVRYVRHALAGTGTSIAFGERLRGAGFASLEDVQGAFEQRFGHLDPQA